MLDNHGSRGGWSKLSEAVNDFQQGDDEIDWENDPVIFVQVFRGVPEAGHWSLLIIDRTVDKVGRLVFIDSLPDMYSDTFDKLKSSLSESPLAPNGCKWVRARMPRQARAANNGLRGGHDMHGCCVHERTHPSRVFLS